MAVNLISPGVKVTEADLVSSVPSVGSTVAGTAGEFRWGPVNDPVLVTNESELLSRFTGPNANTPGASLDFLISTNYLAYSGALYVTRAANTDVAINAAADSANADLIANDDAYEAAVEAGTPVSDGGAWIAKYPGSLGNSLKVSICANTAGFDAWTYESSFDFAPATSPSATTAGSANDEIHIVVVDEGGLFSGVKGTVLEKFAALSKAKDARSTDGGSNYYVSVVNARSKYVRWNEHESAGWGDMFSANTNFGTATGVVDYSLGGGVDGTPGTGDYQTAFQTFSKKETYPVSVLFTGAQGADVINTVVAIAEARKDCMVCFSPEKDDVVNNAGDEATDVVAFADGVTRSTYAVMDGNWKYQYNKYTDSYVWVPLNADVAGCLARVSNNRASWFSPAGYSQGTILNAVKLAWNPNQTERDTLYKNAINPVITQPGRGTILFGDKTFTTRTGSFSRINVRRLFIELEQSVSNLAGDKLFEQNDDATRADFVNTVEPYLRGVQAARGIVQFVVVCNETNNPEDIVNANAFVADIYIRPISSINFIQLNFVSVAGAAQFAAIGG